MVHYIKEARIYKHQRTGKKSLYNWIIQHIQVVQFPIGNYCPKLSIDGYPDIYFVPKLFYQVPVRELHNGMIILPEEDVLKEEIDTENIIIIRNSTLCNIITPQLNTMSDVTR